MAGVIMPDITKFKYIFIEKVLAVDYCTLFFVFTGLRT
jgi:hypothetical protein